MTVATTSAKIQYNGNGSTTAFAVPFKYTDAAHIEVILTSTVGVDATQVLTTHYTLTAPGDTGTATFLIAPPSGAVVTIRRIVPLTQATDLTAGGAFSAAVIEGAFDKLTLLAQQLLEKVRRAAKFKDTTTTGEVTLPEPVASAVLAWNSAGTDLENKAAADLDLALVSPYIATLLNDTTPAAARATLHAEVIFDARDYGLGDGITENTAAINAAIVAASSGGGVVYIPPGTWTLVNTGTADAIVMASNVRLIGAGIDVTVLSLGSAQDAQVISISSDSDVEVSNMTIDGNRATQTAQVHGIRMASASRVSLKHLKIQDCAHYGIGAQDGTIEDLVIYDVLIEDSGGDGIDIKNRNDDNSNITIDNVTVDSWGLNTALTIQAGIDCRGPCKLSNIEIRDPGHTDCQGVRFRQGLEGQAFPEDLGGRHSTISQFIINMGTTGGTTRIGLNVLSDDCKASQGLINGAAISLQAAADRFSAHQVRVQNATNDGFVIAALGVIGSETLDGNSASLVSCVASACTDVGFVVQADNCSLIDCTSVFNDDGIVIESTASNTRVIGGITVSNTTTQFTDSGVSTIHLGLAGQSDNMIAFTDDGATANPILVLRRVSASPAVADVLATLNFQGRDSAAADVVYGGVDSVIVATTAGAATGRLRFRARVAGSNVVVAEISDGMIIGNPTTGFMGAGTLNLDNELYRDGLKLLSTRGAAVADATDAASVILRLNELLARLRSATGHGLIS